MTDLSHAEPQPVAGPTFRRAAGLRVEGNKKRKVLLLIAAYLDAGVQPSVTMIARRAGLPRYVVLSIIPGLGRAGLLRITPPVDHNDRNVYEIPEVGR